MPKAEKEFILNYAMNRWQLNFKKNVGPTSDSIRTCNPSSLEEWREYYYQNVRSEERINNLGHALYGHIASELPTEDRFHPNLIQSITEQDCINYMHMVVINRVFTGFMKERGLL
ncbi:MjaI family restriction endonuclease [Caproiciproducens sp. R2]|uniref:MjaI family restriction endonuclease n=1 Tax=Caproiciproducens sp. R2 TaxID=3435187 RepID=UPI004033DC6F